MTHLKDGLHEFEHYPVNKKARVHLFVEGETLVDDFGRRTSRPWRVWKPIIAAALAEIEVHPTRISWSQYAGCSCPCSPGFILHGVHGVGWWGTIVSEVAQVSNPVQSVVRQASLISAHPDLVQPDETLIETVERVVNH